MEQRLKFHLEFTKGRKIVVWGTGDNAAKVVETLKQFGIEIHFFVSKDYDKLSSYYGKPVYCKNKLDKNDVYVIDATVYSMEITNELEELGFEIKLDFYNWYELILPYDCIYNGIPVGKCSYFPEGFARFMGDSIRGSSIVSIGRFTSINGSVQINADHNLKTISTGAFYPVIGEEFRIIGEKYRDLLKKTGKVAQNERLGNLEIGNDVWIGANVFINLSKVKSIGDGAIIGTGAVVIEDVPPYAVVVGVPAKVKKYRYTTGQIKILDEVKWWNWSNSEINENIELLAEPNKFFEKYTQK